jgi:type II secretory pathway predicted ATPase ExeA
MVTGEIGCGKTLLSRALFKKLTPEQFEVVLIPGPSSQGIELLQEILSHMTKEPIAKTGWELRQAFKQRLMANLQSGKHTIIILDEAQVINDQATFEELRLLLNFQVDDRFLLTLILFGQPELKEKVSLIKPLDQRIEIRYHLKPLNYDEMVRYIDFRLKAAGFKGSVEELFLPDALSLIYQHARGIPRNINNLCDLSLLTAFIAQTRVVDPKIVEHVMEDRD